MYKRRYLNNKFKKALQEFDDDENQKEKYNVEVLTKEIKHIVEPNDPIKKIAKKLKKDTKSKPINTRILLDGFI